MKKITLLVILVMFAIAVGLVFFFINLEQQSSLNANTQVISNADAQINSSNKIHSDFESFNDPDSNILNTAQHSNNQSLPFDASQNYVEAPRQFEPAINSNVERAEGNSEQLIAKDSVDYEPSQQECTQSVVNKIQPTKESTLSLINILPEFVPLFEVNKNPQVNEIGKLNYLALNDQEANSWSLTMEQEIFDFAYQSNINNALVKCGAFYCRLTGEPVNQAQMSINIQQWLANQSQLFWQPHAQAKLNEANLHLWVFTKSIDLLFEQAPRYLALVDQPILQNETYEPNVGYRKCLPKIEEQFTYLDPLEQKWLSRSLVVANQSIYQLKKQYNDFVRALDSTTQRSVQTNSAWSQTISQLIKSEYNQRSVKNDLHLLAVNCHGDMCEIQVKMKAFRGDANLWNQFLLDIKQDQFIFKSYYYRPSGDNKKMLILSYLAKKDAQFLLWGTP